MELKTISGCIFNAHKLLVENCSITSKWGCKSEVNVSKELSVKASDGSIVKYSGNPNMKGIDITTGAKLTKIKEQK